MPLRRRRACAGGRSRGCARASAGRSARASASGVAGAPTPGAGSVAGVVDRLGDIGQRDLHRVLAVLAVTGVLEHERRVAVAVSTPTRRSPRCTTSEAPMITASRRSMRSASVPRIEAGSCGRGAIGGAAISWNRIVASPIVSLPRAPRSTAMVCSAVARSRSSSPWASRPVIPGVGAEAEPALVAREQHVLARDAVDRDRQRAAQRLAEA